MTAADRDSEYALLSGWGRTAPTGSRIVHPRTPEEVAPAIATAQRGVIARGAGRSYGDAAQCAGGLVVDGLGLSGILYLDGVRGEARVLGGTTLDDLMRWLIPQGWFVPVSPGTRHVTVGGAIAADIHGKNHHADGTFAAAVSSLTLQLADGDVLTLGPDHEPTLFWATVGGMGLTGIILDATFRLRRIETSVMKVDTERATDLDETMSLMTSGDDRYRYTVAWIDCVARGRHLGRSVLTRGDHALLEELPAKKRRTARRFNPSARLATPPIVPNGMLNPVTVRAFNEMWFRKSPRHRVDQLQPISTFFHPLDSVLSWNRMYGFRGFLQWQYVVPSGAEETVRTTVERLSGSGCASFLAVLKRFGAADLAPLSFPFPGWTLALDIPIGPPGLYRLLDELDEEVVAAGGRVYLAKDSRVRPELIPAMYPRLDEWREIRAKLDPGAVFRSDLSRRLDLV